jgi:hypothetical protein
MTYNQKKRATLAQIKIERGCEHCNETGFEATELHFHHVDPRTKRFNISKQAHNLGLPKLLAEVAKCEVVCNGCHVETDSYGRYRH